MKDWKKYVAELIGTFVLTLLGCGTATLICCEPFTSDGAIGMGGYVGTAIAFGLTIVAMAYSIGNVSGCHINPAVSLAMLIAKKMSLKDFVFYVISQIIGGILAGLLLWVIFMNYSAQAASNLGSNAIQTSLYADGSNLVASSYILAVVAELVLTFIFVLVILGVTSKKEYSSVAGLVIGGALTLVHLMGIGLTGTSVNPARSIGPAIFAAIKNNSVPLQQIWIFIVGPLAGAALAALVYKLILASKEDKSASAE